MRFALWQSIGFSLDLLGRGGANLSGADHRQKKSDLPDAILLFSSLRWSIPILPIKVRMEDSARYLYFRRLLFITGIFMIQYGQQVWLESANLTFLIGRMDRRLCKVKYLLYSISVIFSWRLFHMLFCVNILLIHIVTFLFKYWDPDPWDHYFTWKPKTMILNKGAMFNMKV